MPTLLFMGFFDPKWSKNRFFGGQKMVQKWPKKARGCPKNSKTPKKIEKMAKTVPPSPHVIALKRVTSSHMDSRQLAARCACLGGLSAGCTHCASGLSGQVRPALSVPVLAHAGAQETLRAGAVAYQGTNLTAKRGLKGLFVAKFAVHLGKKVLCRAWGRVWYSWGSQNKSHVD